MRPPTNSPTLPKRANRLAVLAVMLLLVSTAAAKKHPVPLDKNTDSATCVGCHENKSKGKVVHPAVAIGCTACHEVRTNKEATYVKLITTTTYGVCLTCHADKNAAEIKGQVHQPAIRNCTACHDPHSSENKSLLLKPTSGGKGENLCLNCHTKGIDVPEKGSRHAALDMGCETCHLTHKTGERGKVEFDYHLTKATPALCLDCHDAKDASLQKAHQDQPFAGANCLQCHDAHQSRSPKLMQAFTHNPFENKMCDSCHQPAKDGKVALTQSDSRALCLTCHEDKGKQIESAKVQHPGAQGECIACHNPHAGRTPGFIQPDPVSACLACHSEQAEQMKKAHLHQPAYKQGCATCHQPHGGNNEHLLRAQGNALCLECHGPDSRPQKLEAQHAVAIFGGAVLLPEDYYQKNRIVVLPIKYGLGHPVLQHPVQDVVDPTNVAKVLKKISCLTCHQPHSSAQPDLLVKDQANNMAFCDTCHKNRLELGAK